MVSEEDREVTSREFITYGHPLEIVNSFRYLGRGVSTADYNLPVLVRNLARARAVWRRMTRILSREGEETQVSGFLFKAIVHLVLIFGAETWVPPRMVRVLGGSRTRWCDN